MVAAVIAMAVCYGAYMGEIFRAGIQSIPKGQMEAAIALGHIPESGSEADNPASDHAGDSSGNR